MRLHVGQNRVFIQKITDDARNVRVQPLVVGHARARRVGEHQVPGAVGVEEAGGPEHGVFPEGDRIQKIVVDPPVETSIRRRPAAVRAYSVASCTMRSRPSTRSIPISPARNACS